MNRLPRTVVFDLDGTLVDTAPDLTAALNHALAHLGRPSVPGEDVRMMVGHGARRLLEKGLAATGELTPELVEAGFPVFMDYYSAHIADGSVAYPGIEAAMDELAAAGCTLAVCTNKPTSLSVQLVDALGWGGRFAANIGGDRPNNKPHASHLLDTIAAAGGDPSDTVYVGDSITDTTTAINAKVPCVAVSFGFSDRPAGELGASVVINDFAQLVGVLRGMARAQ